MTYLKYLFYSVMIVLIVGTSVLVSLQYFAADDDMQYYYIAYEEPAPVTFCLNDPEKNIEYKEKVLYVRPVARPFKKAQSHGHIKTRLVLPTPNTTEVQKDFMEFYIKTPSEKK